MSKEKAVEKSEEKKEAESSLTASFATGKRRRAVAKASIKPGTGIVSLNAVPVEQIKNLTVRLLVQEPLIILGDACKKFNIKVTAKGGGIIGQAQAARQAIAKALADVLGPETRRLFMSYDRNMLVYDPRRTEPHKPPRSSQGPRRYKQRSKR